ncbi:cytochrome P450 [Hygrophoropsis aurantiaca]|uniref:Cytochrome P450 n=1 Tax=Hygrophoropsis aurantiaca TaxID=72124 RepID=A0ACB8A402_9AGAM|nr:cytochrome P450 [Hygrophoropsis aurantiaca]
MIDLIGRQNNVGFTYYGEKLKASRKLLHAALNPRTRCQWAPLLEEDTSTVLRDLLDSPHDWERHVKMHVASVVVRFTYGTNVTEDYVHLAEEINAHTGLALQPGWLVDSFPFLAVLPAWLPGMHFKKWANIAKSKFRQCTEEPYLATRAAVVSYANSNSDVYVSRTFDSFVADNLKSVIATSPSNSESILMHAAGSVYGAATDTYCSDFCLWAVALLMSFILLMTAFRNVQEKAYNEIASVVGHALIKDLHRFNPYDGDHIPRKAWVMCNVWSMTPDSDIYSDLDVFNPERHLHETTKDPRDFTFGFGRRSCPGIHFANAETSIPSAPFVLLATFTSQPMPFACQFCIGDPRLVELL